MAGAGSQRGGGTVNTDQPPSWVIAKWCLRWKKFTPKMKEMVRYLGKRGGRQRRHIPGATMAALRRQHIIYEHAWDKIVHVHLNSDGCDLIWWLRWSKQLTKDKADANQ
jgi:hypothetical protein